MLLPRNARIVNMQPEGPEGPEGSSTTQNQRDKAHTDMVASTIRKLHYALQHRYTLLQHWKIGVVGPI